jgi:hypothetical protein
MKKTVWNAIALAMIVLVVVVAVLSVRVEEQSQRDEAQPADVILVLGAAEYAASPHLYSKHGSITPWNSTSANWLPTS